MPAAFHRLRLGTCVCYLLPAAGGWVLIDAGNRGRANAFVRKLGRLGIKPADIRLIVLTHTHFDHVGSLAAIKELCGCAVAVHAAEAQRLAQGRADIPPGNRAWSRFLVSRAHLLQPRWPRFRAVEPEVIINGDTDLADWGLEARVIHTPGHTSGSLSVLTPDGDAFVGDLCVYDPPFTGPPCIAALCRRHGHDPAIMAKIASSRGHGHPSCPPPVVSRPAAGQGDRPGNDRGPLKSQHSCKVN